MQGILLAAGHGKRFHATQDKLLTNLNGQPILWHSAKALITALPNSIAVIQPHQTERKILLAQLGFNIIESVRAKEGMGFAIADAVQASQDAQGWLITLADMPWITEALIKRVSAHINGEDSIAAPRFDGKRGQPVAFGPAWYAALRALEGDKGARDLLRRENINWVEWTDESIHRDVDTLADMHWEKRG